MPHDCHGRLIEVGDKVKGGVSSQAFVGPVMHIYPGTSTCNLLVGEVSKAAYGLSSAFIVSSRCVTAGEVELVHKADGSAPPEIRTPEPA